MKQLLYRLLGRRNTKRLYWLAQGLLRGKRPTFSEAEMIIDYFEAHPRRGSMLDVGVHFGESCLPYAQMGWQIVGFEPDPANRAKIPPIAGLKLYDNAVSDRDGQVLDFFASDESSGISSLSSFHASHRAVAQVTTVTLATVLAREGLGQIDFLKIDIEGHDLFALRGFPFDKVQPEVILCEFEDSKTVPNGYTYRDLGDFLAGQGYQVYLSEWHPIVRYGGEHTWRQFVPYPAKLADARGWGNFVAIRPEHQAAFARVRSRYFKFIGQGIG
jgi:FkbM family methyltransferase